MVVKYQSKIMKVGNSLVLVLPKAVCDGFNLVKGQVLEMIIRDDGISIPIQENPIEDPVELDIQEQLSRRTPERLESSKSTRTKLNK